MGVVALAFFVVESLLRGSHFGVFVWVIHSNVPWFLPAWPAMWVSGGLPFDANKSGFRKSRG